MRGEFLAVALCTLSAGCNIHPLPEDISKPDTTYQIVAKIRCETRDAIRNKVIAYLKSSRVHKIRNVGASLENGSKKFSSIKYVEIDPETRNNIQIYEDTAIAYDFTIDIKNKKSNIF